MIFSRENVNAKKKITEILKKRVLLLDGATGTELQKRGMPGGVSPELWSLEHPEVLQSVHADYERAGSDVVFSCTFGANRFKLSQFKKNIKAAEVNRKLASFAREALKKETLVAGDIGPTGRFISPFGDLDFDEAVESYKEQARGLLEGGADLFVIETMIDIQEARAALIAVKEITDRFAMVTLTFDGSGKTLNGTDPVTALVTLQSLGADAFGCNCSTGPEEMLPFIQAMKPHARIPLIAKPNAGLPKLSGNKTVYDMDAEKFASFGKKFVSAGAGMLGGCCGTSPLYIEKLKKQTRSSRPASPERRSAGALTSARKTVFIEEKSPLLIVGERINPTGKKDLQKEISEGKTELVRRMAKEQEKKGADLLDVNVGVPGIDDVAAMKKVVGLLSTATDLPLVIDSSKVETIESALRLYPGRALINSISGEKEKLKKLLPIARKYGSMFILLPLSDKDIPKTAEKRKQLIKKIFAEAQKHGFTRDDIIVDGLVMTVSSDPYAAVETLKTIDWCTREFRCRTVVGLSNVSFGLPQRKWINASFLAMAAAKGLTMAIANPEAEELMSIAAAGDVLLGKDRDALSFIKHFSEQPAQRPPQESPDSLPPEKKVAEAILSGNRESVKGLVEEALRSGIAAARLVEEYMIPAITRVGELFEKKEYFLPQLIAGAETMKLAFSALEPLLLKSGTAKTGRRILLATVKGDIHDIGKNIVALMLKNHGFDVIDIGKDVPSEKIVEKIRSISPAAVCLSALMTTTMVRMKETIDLANEQGLKCPFLVGGAVVTKSYADSINAHYARDGVEAVRVVKSLLG